MQQPEDDAERAALIRRLEYWDAYVRALRAELARRDALKATASATTAAVNG